METGTEGKGPRLTIVCPGCTRTQQTLTSHSFFIGHLSFVIDPFRSSSLEFSLQVAPAPRQSELPKREGGYALLFATRQRLTEKVVKKSTSRGVAWVSARPQYWSG